MKSNCVETTKCTNGGKNLFSHNGIISFPDCKPVARIVTGNIESDFKDFCTAILLCSWHMSTSSTHMVPAPGCKLSKEIVVTGDMTISGESSGEINFYRELQANRVDNGLSTSSRHFKVATEHTLELKYLNLTWGGIEGYGGCILMAAGNLILNASHFYGGGLGQQDANSGGAIYAYNSVKSITITDSTFEGFGAKDKGGALFIYDTSTTADTTAVTITSTTFIDNWADVSSLINFNLFYFMIYSISRGTFT